MKSEIRNFLVTTNWEKGIGDLIESLPDYYFFVKNSRGEFIWVNQNFLNQTGYKSLDDIYKKSDFDVWPSHLATLYVQDDKKVMDSGKPIKNRIELIKNKKAGFDWYSTSKAPLFNATGSLIGVAGHSVFIRKKSESTLPAFKMAPVVEHIMANYRDNITMEQLAGLVSLSVSGFERKFKKYFDTTPLKFINKVRIEAACQLLADSSLNLSEVALETGYYDSSHFTKQFKAYTNMHPRAYRDRHFRLP